MRNGARPRRLTRREWGLGRVLRSVRRCVHGQSTRRHCDACSGLIEGDVDIFYPSPKE